jgi:ATP-dependent helicase HrpB
MLAGFPDRVARRRARGSPRAIMVGGTGVVLAPESVVREAELFVAVDLERTGGPEARVRAASAVEAAWLAELFPGAVRETRELVFDPDRARVVARIRTCYQDLVLAERVGTDVDRAAAGAVLAAHVATLDPSSLLGDAGRALLARLEFLGRAMPELGWPTDPRALAAEALSALCVGRASLAELGEADLGAAIRGLLAPAQRAALAREAPTEYRLPSGRTTAVRYPPDRSPAVAARIQELFGLTTTPRLAAGRVPLVFELLAPNQRPVQVTDDLASFWRTTYPEVRRQLRGRYPKHAWPDDPLRASPSARPGRRR